METFEKGINYDEQTESLFDESGKQSESDFPGGKSSLTPELTAAIGESFNNNELIKIGVLKNCFDDPRAIAEMVAERTHSQVVQVIGKKIVLYKPDKDKPKIELPR